MSANKLPVIGHWTCEEGGQAEVTQTRRIGKFFNTRCDCCGFSQATGKARQQKIYNTAVWVSGAVVDLPKGIVEKSASAPEPAPEQAPKPEPKPEQKPPSSGDFVPEPEPEPEPEQRPNAAPISSEKPPKQWGKLAAGLVFLGTAAAVSIWKI